jgi:plastocyanin
MKIHNVSGIFKTDLGKEIPILSGDIDHFEQWSYTFEESGVFEYICGYHEGKGMKGELIVS